MLVDSTLTKAIAATRSAAAAIEDAGYDGLWVGETRHEPFLQLLQAADVTSRLTIGTSIAIAFARSPMTMANAGYDLAEYSAGRFVLGLGSQVKPYIERRFSMPWSHPAPRMREFVMALRAIWRSWETGDQLDFRGDFYSHRLMTSFFAPEPHAFGPPPVYLAGVGERMTEVAGEVCDGFFFHAFTTERYLRDVTIPALMRGRSVAGRAGLDGFGIAGPAFVCVGRNEAEMAVAVAGTKNQIAFYASTPAYRPVLELHGWGDIQPELTRLSKAGRWAEMGEIVDDEMLQTFAVVGEPAAVGRALAERWGRVATRVTLYATYPSDPAVWTEVVAGIRA